MAIYVNNHRNAVHIVVDDELKIIEPGEKFSSKRSLDYDSIDMVGPLKSPPTKNTKQKKGVNDVSKRTS